LFEPILASSDKKGEKNERGGDLVYVEKKNPFREGKARILVTKFYGGKNYYWILFFREGLRQRVSCLIGAQLNEEGKKFLPAKEKH